jgi:predicted dehydrogenase
MSESNRREFLKSGTLALGGTAALGFNQVLGANERIVLGVIGCGGMGSNHLKQFASYGDVEIAYVCDPDGERLSNAARNAEKAGAKSSKAVKDLRQIMEDKAVDAVVIATPDHWHAPAAILACDAGKHVYVEKPCSHNIREGRLMVEAARRNKRIVQVGTQSRSTGHVMEAMQKLREGVIGDVLVAKAWNSQLRRTMGKQKPSAPPPHLDYNLWVGPAPMMPFQPNRSGHDGWHWAYDFGTGDMGNDGVHDIDIARWGLGVDTHPTTVTALGGKFFFDDDQEFPDTQYVVFEYAPPGEPGPSGPRFSKTKQLIYEHRIWSPYFQEGHENGNAFYGTKGMMILGKHGGYKIIGERNKTGESASGGVDLPAHHRNFLDCIRGAQSGKLPNADIEIGHLSATLCHLGNVATRFEKTISFDPKTEKITNDSDAAALVRRTYRDHWATPKNV